MQDKLRHFDFILFANEMGLCYTTEKPSGGCYALSGKFAEAITLW